MTNPLIRKLETFAPLSEADKLLLESLIQSARTVEAHVDLAREGDTPTEVHLIIEGFACRYKMLPSGTRHIMAYLIPGDFCDVHGFILKTLDHSIATLSRCQVVDISNNKVLELTERPALARALWWSALVDGATLGEWLVNIGARPAHQRIAHLLCELLLRLRSVGLANGGAYELPITQAEIADTMGLTYVHTNRVLQRLRSENMITLKDKRLVILNIDRLIAFSGFNPNYLHLEPRPPVEIRKA